MIDHELQQAWQWRQALGFIQTKQALRVFHGPGESAAGLKNISVDKFLNHYMITRWETQKAPLLLRTKSKSPSQAKDLTNTHLIDTLKDTPIDTLINFYRRQNAQSIVLVNRPLTGLAPKSISCFGSPPKDRIVVSEDSLKFYIKLSETRHSGLFLDHAPLRSWLRTHARGLSVLNLFAYTGSLSLAAADGHANHVSSIDLSQSSSDWAMDNFSLNGISKQKHRWIVGDVFEWLKRLKKEAQCYDCIILDPPSFSRSKSGSFSTAKDLTKLHESVLGLLAPNSYLITSINSANITQQRFEQDILAASKKEKAKLTVLKQIELPESFPTPLGKTELRYLKGFILKKNS